MVMVVVQNVMMVMARGGGARVGPDGRAGDRGVIVRGRHVEQRLGIANKFVNVPFACGQTPRYHNVNNNKIIIITARLCAYVCCCCC